MSVSGVLLHILVALLAAKLAAEVAERIRVPTVVGEIVAGILIGPSVLGLVGEDATLAVLGEIGVILLLLSVGLEMSLADLGAVGRASLAVAVLGIAVPMVGGIGVATAFGHHGDVALFLGAALAATSVGITARVFSELRALARVEARTVLGAAVADDVLGLVILTVVVRIASEGSVSPLAITGIVALAVGFIVVTAFVGTRLGPPLFELVTRRARSAGTLVGLALAFTLGFAELADAARLAPIVGAFIAGIALSGSGPSERIRRELTPVGHLFIPVFFLQIGIAVDIASFAEPEVLAIGGALIAVAVAGKIVAGIAAGQTSDRLLVGLGMIPRGEVGLIFATIGLREGILSADLYAALLLVVLATTLAAPPLLSARLARSARRQDRHPSVPTVAPPGGWLLERDGVVDVAAPPPDRLALHLGLEAALAVAEARPGPGLLDWLGGLGDTPLRWDDDATSGLTAVLVRGNARSWRFLEATGLLERALPELAEALARRRADPVLVDPSHVLRFSLAERVRDLTAADERAAAEHALLTHPEWLLLAALILDAAGDDDAQVALARRLVKRLDLGAAAEEEVALLVGERALLRAAATRVDGLEPEPVLQLAIHLHRPERVRALYLLSLALGPLDPWDRERLDELVGLVLAALGRPELTGLDASNVVERRRAEAVRIGGEGSRAAERVRRAPRAHVLAQEAAEVARQAAFLEPLPRRGEARVAVWPLGRGEWQVEVAARDRRGLLATVTGVLAGAGLDVLDAVVATWPDGGALESFRVRRGRGGAHDGGHAEAPEGGALEAWIEAALAQPLPSPPCPDAEVTFDDDGSPWYTRCEVRSPDRRGLLHTITTALAGAGASVHSARLVTERGQVVDRFELTDPSGRKLDAAGKEAVRRAIRDGVAPGRRGLRWRRRSDRRQERDVGRSRARTGGETRSP